MNHKKPNLMTVRQVAKTGILPEHALRSMLKSGMITAVYVGRKAFINYDTLCQQLSRLGEKDFSASLESKEYQP
ncbi:MAG: hypothetical protein Q4C53_08425 [Clostridia bacterium]|nr:hypothetical protein [Clostridia bacterium]